MKWPPWLWPTAKGETDGALQLVQRRFAHFLALLDANNRALKLVADFEEKANGDFLFDVNYIHSTLAEVRSGVRQIIESMIEVGGADYEVLRERFDQIESELVTVLTGKRPIPPDELTIVFEELDRDRAASVGGKNAQLGEITSKLGLPVPGGFAISAWAYKRFIDANDLQRRIDQCIEQVDFTRFADLAWMSEKIQSLVLASKVPDDLEQAIRRSVEDLQCRTGADRFALRSSAIGEDEHVSFAGQYRSLLNVRADDVVDRYREVLAGKFTPKAIYYQLSHAYRESELAMCVGCIAMIDAASSGVIYTRHPVQPDDDCLLINSVFGLGQLLVDGTLTPDVFRVERETGRLLESTPCAQGSAHGDVGRIGDRHRAGPRAGSGLSLHRRLWPGSEGALGAAARVALRRAAGHRVGAGPRGQPVPVAGPAAQVGQGAGPGRGTGPQRPEADSLRRHFRLPRRRVGRRLSRLFERRPPRCAR